MGTSLSRLILSWLPLWLGLSLTTCAQSESVDFTLPDVEGKQRSLSEFRGKWVVVNYWATWCPPCREEMPELEVFHANHKDDDAVVLGVNMEKISQARLREFAEEQFISFPILREQPRARTELGKIPGLPTSYLIDPEGRVVGRQVGPLTLQRLERLIEELELARAEVSASGSDQNLESIDIMTDTKKEKGAICVLCHVAGRVQGVFFRASTREQAQRLGLTGYARNLSDGRVQVFACGAPDAVAKLKEWLRTGPPAARVSGVACETAPEQNLAGFSTG